MVDLERINLMEPIEFETWVLIQIKLPVKSFQSFASDHQLAIQWKVQSYFSAFQVNINLFP